MTFTFEAGVISWKGPAPFVFVPAPSDVATAIKEASRQLSYGWGCIPATVSLGQTTFTTSLIPRNDTYVVPIKVAVQRAENVEVGDTVRLSVMLNPKN